MVTPLRETFLFFFTKIIMNHDYTSINHYLADS